MANLLHIITADKKTFHVEFEVARQSQTIRNMLDNLNIQEGGDGENILPLTNEEITGPILKKALVWMEKNRGKPDFQADDKKDAAKIDQEIVNLGQLNQWEKLYLADMMADKEDMLRLLKVACILEIMSLVNLLTIGVSIFKRRERTLIIKTADKRTFHVELEVARQSQTIRNMLDDLNIQEGGDGDNILPLTNEDITGPIFTKALIWMERSRGKPDFQPDEEKDEENVDWDQFNQWEKLYLADMMADKDDMFCLWNVAIILKIVGLVNLLTKAIHILNRREKTLIIITADKETFNVELEVARQSQTIRNMLDDLNITEAQIGSAGSENTLPLTNEEITGPLFKKALIWMEKNRGKPDFQPDDDTNLSNELKALKDEAVVYWGLLNQWEKLYVSDMLADVDDMLRLLIVANFLEIKGLVDLMTTAIALQIQGRTEEEIREAFHVKDPKYTKKELAKINEENPWGPLGK